MVMNKLFSDQKYLLEQAFDGQTTVFNGMTVEWKLGHKKQVYMLQVVMLA